MFWLDAILLKRGSDSARVRIIRKWAAAKEPRLIDTIRPLLRDDSYEVRGAAFGALARYATSGRGLADELLAALETEPDVGRRCDAFRALAAVATDDRRLAAELMRVFAEESEAWVRRILAQALIDSRAPVQEQLAEILLQGAGGAADLRQLAAQVLGELAAHSARQQPGGEEASASAIEALVRYQLEEQDHVDAVMYTAEALGRIGTGAAVHALVELLERTQHWTHPVMALADCSAAEAQDAMRRFRRDRLGELLADQRHPRPLKRCTLCLGKIGASEDACLVLDHREFTAIAALGYEPLTRGRVKPEVEMLDLGAGAAGLQRSALRDLLRAPGGLVHLALMLSLAGPFAIDALGLTEALGAGTERVVTMWREIVMERLKGKEALQRAVRFCHGHGEGPDLAARPPLYWELCEACTASVDAFAAS